MTDETQDNNPKPLTGRQRKFLKAYAAQLGNVAKACRKSGTHRSTVYAWLKSDESDSFRHKMNEINGDFIDLGESKLLKLVKKNHFPAIKLLLQTKGRSRGYGKAETVNMQVSNGFTEAEADKMREGYRRRKGLEREEAKHVATLAPTEQAEYWDKRVADGANPVNIERQKMAQQFYNSKFVREAKEQPVNRFKANVDAHKRGGD